MRKDRGGAGGSIINVASAAGLSLRRIHNAAVTKPLLRDLNSGSHTGKIRVVPVQPRISFRDHACKVLEKSSDFTGTLFQRV